MADIEVQVKGLRELGEALKQLPKALRGRALGAAVKAAAVLVQDQGRANARAQFKEPTGATEQAIVAYRKRGSTQDNITYQVGVTMQKRYPRPGGKNYPPFWWRYQEFGTRKQAAKPFLRPAFDTRSGEALALIKKMLEKAVEIAAQAAPKFGG